MRLGLSYSWFGTCCFLVLTSISSLVSAHNNVVVVPLWGDEASGKDSIRNVITVATDGGDFKSPVDAMESITDASSENPYLIAIGPGDYIINETLKVKSYVSIIGSGIALTRLISGREYPTVLINLEFVTGSRSNTVGVQTSPTSISDLSLIHDSRGLRCETI